ncbi:hypothetical protein [Zunongwangia profunda]|uniref:hypothetical protein n=1 Tax=Zunongwangia profunda TaxID=398743 RepID=UPI00248D9A0E|nr:hypothetical protein [Zunongwangia profunda]
MEISFLWFFVYLFIATAVGAVLGLIAGLSAEDYSNKKEYYENLPDECACDLCGKKHPRIPQMGQRCGSCWEKTI